MIKKSFLARLGGFIDRWHGEVILMGDFNEVRSESKRHCFVFIIIKLSCLTSLL